MAEGESEGETSIKSEEEDVLDVGDGIEGGGGGSMMEDDADGNGDTEEEEDDAEDDQDMEDTDRDTEDDEEELDPIMGNGFVEEVAAELAGSRTRRGRRYDGGGGHL